MKRQIIVGLILWCGLSQLHSAERYASEQPALVEVKRNGEGTHEVLFLNEKSGLKEKIWLSFWGIVEAKASEGGEFLALHDRMRMGVMSTVAIFRITNEGADLIYQTPSAAASEESFLDFEMGGFEGDAFEIKVMKFENRGGSRPEAEYKFSYRVGNLSKRPKCGPLKCIFCYSRTEK